MTAYLMSPVSPRRAVLLALLLLVGGGLYCSLYNLFQGRPESPLVGMLWSAVNLLPWLAAFEICKRMRETPPGARRGLGLRIALVLLAAAFASIALDLAGRPVDAQTLAFEAVRRLPGAGLVIAALRLAILQRGEPAQSRTENPSALDGADRLPLLPQQIDWIKAAGNYLEFRSGARVVLHRMTMAEAEALLAGEGFIRIHRSALVNASRVVRVAGGKAADEVGLADGTRLKVGGAYRPFVARLALKAGT